MNDSLTARPLLAAVKRASCCMTGDSRSAAQTLNEDANVGHQRCARTAASDKSCMREMLIARPLHAIVGMAVKETELCFERRQPPLLCREKKPHQRHTKGEDKTVTETIKTNHCFSLPISQPADQRHH
jgi:hypothetical protein